MNSTNQNTLTLDRVLFDRLADGALSDSDYRRVLIALENQPAAWRTCAEAFLEAQAWRRDFGVVRAAAEIKPTEPAASKSATKYSNANWQQMLFVAAASFLFAFFAAQAFWTMQQPPGIQSAPPLAAGPTTKVPETGNAESQPTTHNQPLGKVQLAVNRLGQESPTMVDVDVFDQASASQMLSYPALSDDLVEALAAEGHQINRQPQFISIPLEDGQQMMLPVESYRIVPVSRRSY